MPSLLQELHGGNDMLVISREFPGLARRVMERVNRQEMLAFIQNYGPADALASLDDRYITLVYRAYVNAVRFRFEEEVNKDISEVSKTFPIKGVWPVTVIYSALSFWKRGSTLALSSAPAATRIEEIVVKREDEISRSMAYPYIDLLREVDSNVF
jgi:hypothetical protein